MSKDWPDPEELEEDHSHPMGWLQVVLYIALIGALGLGVWFLISRG